jgi:hypothetical protein
MVHRCPCADRDGLLLDAQSALKQYLEVIARFCSEDFTPDLKADKRHLYQRESEKAFESAKASWEAYRKHRAAHGC